MKPKVLILKTDGINCDEELAYAFRIAGGNPEYVHINQLRKEKNSLSKFHILALPGGFSYGDDIFSGKILAVELTSYFADAVKKFIKRKDTLVIGICNGFQVLVRTGMLPFGRVGTMDTVLANNDSGHLECRWVHVKISNENTSPFFTGMQNSIVSYQVAHGEGKFFAADTILEKIENEHLVGLRYVDQNGRPSQNYPSNPNGSLHAIAGITDPSGRILGLMPHPERFVLKEQNPNWKRNQRTTPHGQPIFFNAINFVKQA